MSPLQSQNLKDRRRATNLADQEAKANTAAHEPRPRKLRPQLSNEVILLGEPQAYEDNIRLGSLQAAPDVL
jgi:hypothetical protein